MNARWFACLVAVLVASGRATADEGPEPGRPDAMRVLDDLRALATQFGFQLRTGAVTRDAGGDIVVSDAEAWVLRSPAAVPRDPSRTRVAAAARVRLRLAPIAGGPDRVAEIWIEDAHHWPMETPNGAIPTTGPSVLRVPASLAGVHRVRYQGVPEPRSGPARAPRRPAATAPAAVVADLNWSLDGRWHLALRADQWEPLHQASVTGGGEMSGRVIADVVTEPDGTLSLSHFRDAAAAAAAAASRDAPATGPAGRGP